MPLYEPRNEPDINGFRLTGISGTPVMNADNTAYSTVYLTPYIGNRIALYNGASWDTMQSGEVSLALTGRTTDLPFDIYAFNNNGVLTLETLNWTSATARATGLVLVDGVWTKGTNSRSRFVGTCRPRSATTFSWVTAGNDLPAKLDLWNMNNRVGMPWTMTSTVDTWNYTTATWRQAQGSTNYQCDFVAGLAECTMIAKLTAASSNSDALVNRQRAVGIGFDATNTPSVVGTSSGSVSADTSTIVESSAQISRLMPIGRHFLAWLEISDSGGTTTWMGDNGLARMLAGFTGVWMC